MVSNLPLDASRKPVQLVPALAALEETYDETISATTEITLQATTTLIEVVVGGEGVFMKWGEDDATTADWDHFIPEGTTRHFVVPIESGTTLYTAVNFIERTTTAYLTMSEFAG